MIVRLVDIGGIVDLLCLNFLFIIRFTCYDIICPNWRMIYLSRIEKYFHHSKMKKKMF